MVYHVVTREQWDARPPRSVTPLKLANVDKFIVHYSGASRDQSVRSIQNYCMDSKGHSDIDYSYLVRGLDLYIGRGDNEGSHTLGNNATSYGICVIGNDGDATDDDFRVVRTVYDELCTKLGRTLRFMGHNQAPGLAPGYTSCPGSEIQTWINQGMPYPEDEMLTALQAAQVNNSEHYLQAVVGMAAEAENISNTVQHDLSVPNLLTAALARIEEKVSVGSVTGISEDRLRVIIREEIAKTRLS